MMCICERVCISEKVLYVKLHEHVCVSESKRERERESMCNGEYASEYQSINVKFIGDSPYHGLCRTLKKLSCKYPVCQIIILKKNLTYTVE